MKKRNLIVNFVLTIFIFVLPHAINAQLSKPHPDLQVSIKCLSTVNIGDDVNIVFRVKNIGNVAARSSRLESFVFEKGTISYTVPDLPPGKYWSVNRKVKYPKAGIKNISAKADADGRVRNDPVRNNFVEKQLKVCHVLPQPRLRAQLGFGGVYEMVVNEDIIVQIHVYNPARVKSLSEKLTVYITEQETVEFTVPPILPDTYANFSINAKWTNPGEKTVKWVTIPNGIFAKRPVPQSHSETFGIW